MRLPLFTLILAIITSLCVNFSSSILKRVKINETSFKMQNKPGGLGRAYLPVDCATVHPDTLD